MRIRSTLTRTTTHRRKAAPGLLAMLSSAVLGLSLAFAAPTTAGAAMFECEDESNLCVEGAGSFEADKSSTSKDRGKRSKSSGGTLTLRVEDGRGSVFINGRYAGTAPLEGVAIPAGKNDLQIRDGSDVLASGLLTVPKSGDVVVAVRHP